MLLSATIADTPEKFAVFAYVLKFAEKLSEVHDVPDDASITAIRDWISRARNPVMSIYSMLYPSRASRMSIRDLGNLFPETQISSMAYNMGKKETELIEKEYDNIAEELDKLKDKKFTDKLNPFVILLRAHQKIELLKCATIIDLTKDHLENKFSVCIFVNFTQTIKILKEELKTNCIIIGGQTLQEREENIKKFQDNKSRVIICNIKAGGIGISLHDVHGDHPRVSLISPSWDATSLVQTLGRVHRAGGKTKSLQRIVFCAGTIEERISKVLSTKLNNLSSINDGDLVPFDIFKKNEKLTNNN
jgi:SNF2 family DNA or RNA helicase